MKTKEFQSFLRNSLFFRMTAEQEMGYQSARAKHILKYERLLLLFIIASQLYNILYVLIYTKGRLNTTASRVYTVLYSILILVSLASLIFTVGFKKFISDNPRILTRLQILFGIFILTWGACVTVYDQRVSENVSAYMIISLIVAMVIDFTPLQAILTYGTLQLLLFWFLPLLKDPAKDSYGENVNLTIMTLMCIIISIYHYYYSRKHYLYRQIILGRNSELENIAYKDSLTGLDNRRFLEDEMDSIFQQSFREKSPLTFMMLDIDKFKQYNDRYGHLQGDECLRRVTWRIHSAINKENEYLIRYGGEEFLYIGVGIDDSAAESKAAYFNKIIRELVIGPSDQEPMGVTVSVGSYTVKWDETAEHTTTNWENCVNEADKALYMAKNNGRDNYSCLKEKH